MTWTILWALIFVFALCAVVQAVGRSDTITSLLGDVRRRAGAVTVPQGRQLHATTTCPVGKVPLAVTLWSGGVKMLTMMGGRPQ